MICKIIKTVRKFIDAAKRMFKAEPIVSIVMLLSVVVIATAAPQIAIILGIGHPMYLHIVSQFLIVDISYSLLRVIIDLCWYGPFGMGLPHYSS